MKQIINKVIALLSIILSLITYSRVYFIFLNSSMSSKGFVEFFTVLSSILFISCSFCLTSIVNNQAKPKIFLALLIYCLLGVLPLGVINYHTLTPTMLASTVTILISMLSYKTISINTKLIINGTLLVVTSTWCYLMFYV